MFLFAHGVDGLGHLAHDVEPVEHDLRRSIGQAVSRGTDVRLHITVTPTASSRTLLTLDTPVPFMIKTNMTAAIGGVRRKMRRSAVAHSHEIMRDLAESADEAPAAIAVLPETLGVVFEGEAGMLIRECRPRPVGCVNSTVIE